MQTVKAGTWTLSGNRLSWRNRYGRHDADTIIGTDVPHALVRDTQGATILDYLVAQFAEGVIVERWASTAKASWHDGAVLCDVAEARRIWGPRWLQLKPVTIAAKASRRWARIAELHPPITPEEEEELAEVLAGRPVDADPEVEADLYRGGPRREGPLGEVYEIVHAEDDQEEGWMEGELIEGPFSTLAYARQFARAEVGVPYKILARPFKDTDDKE